MKEVVNRKYEIIDQDILSALQDLSLLKYLKSDNGIWGHLETETKSRNYCEFFRLKVQKTTCEIVTEKEYIKPLVSYKNKLV